MTEHPHNLEPDLAHARQTALMAHAVVIRLKEMGLPEDFDEALGIVSTDLSDIWAAQKVLSARLDYLVEHADDWESVADCLVDLRATIDHISTHVATLQEPIEQLAQYAYEQV
jgi:uncharacterized protein YigA (DUF484 family)